MVGTLVAFFVVIWFYMTAQRVGRQPISWAVAGLVVYFMVCLVWTWFVTPILKDSATHTQNGVLIFFTQYGYVIMALICAGLFNMKVSELGRLKDNDEE